ncbi:poly-gamma-glutamate hydrolase family protein [Micromonospora sp. NPDC048999]|uniref:poly-gamma-glutamate hydrolase family protein n=1 Tax=Micromonospora sp. NPDC048999 TaxID=3155391 RepID=UPI0033FC4DD5
MPIARRRTVLAALASAAVATPALLAARPTSALAADRYASNTRLYADPTLVEGTDYARRYRRQPAFDDALATNTPYPQVAVIAPHGGGIEVGTSELCLAIAGYHPATLAPATDGRLYDYWMFEGLRSSGGNGELHVTSTNCDDPYAESTCGGARYAVSLHGCTEADAGVGKDVQAVLIGGLDATFRELLRQEYNEAGITLAGGGGGEIDGIHPRNICNRTLTGKGAQLELTTALRNAMFGDNTRAGRKTSTQPIFGAFVEATRKAIARRVA